MRQIHGNIFVISGPSGSGKTTLLKTLLKDKQLNKLLVKSISFTTRPKRSGEKNKRDYFFVTEKQFRQEQKAKKILEWTKYLGYYYATPKDFVESQLAAWKHIVLCLNLAGALTLKRLYPKNTVTIFILPPSLRTLKNRIGRRCSKTKKEEIKQRLKLAREEITCSSRYDYCLVNNELHQAVKTLKDIILKEIGV